MVTTRFCPAMREDFMTTSTMHETIQHLNTFLGLSELGSKPTPYLPTYQFTGSYINENHAYYANCPTGYKGINICIDTGIDGYLQSGDALKIYELAYFAKGNILELGTYCGLSTSIIAQAIYDSKKQIRFETVDIDKDANALAQKNVQSKPGRAPVEFNLLDATEYMEKAIVKNNVYDFIFIDHWHGYDATYEAAMRAKKLLSPGGFCLFHDYNDPANADPEHVYGVYQGANDAMLTDPNFDFYGTFGCTALFRKSR